MHQWLEEVVAGSADSACFKFKVLVVLVWGSALVVEPDGYQQEGTDPGALCCAEGG